MTIYYLSFEEIMHIHLRELRPLMVDGKWSE